MSSKKIKLRRNIFWSNKEVFLYYLLIILINFILYKLLFNNLENVTAVYTILEVLGICIIFIIFLIIWYTYERNSTSLELLGFGLIMVIVFKIFHVYFFHQNTLTTDYDLAMLYSILARFTESIMFWLFCLEISKKRINKWVGFLASLFFAFLLTIAIFFAKTYLVSFNLLNFKINRIIFECIIIVILYNCIFRIAEINELSGDNSIKYKHILMAVLLAVSSEITVFFKNLHFFKHLLSISCYTILLEGVFLSVITLPYSKLESARKYLENLLDGLPIAVITFDKNLKVSYVNKKALNLLGYYKNELIGLTSKEMLNKFYGENYQGEPLIDKSYRELTPIYNELRTVKKKDGSKINLKIDVELLGNGEYMYLLKEAKKEQELKNLKLQTQTIIDSINNAVVIYDKDGKIVKCNKAFEEAVEMETKELLGMNKTRLLQCIDFEISEFLDINNKKLYEITLITPKSNKKHFLVYSSNIYNIEGEYIGKIHIGSDITIKKKKELECLQREKLALLGQMAAGIVHEIKNPLTTIKGFCQYLIPLVNDEKVKNCLKLVENETNDVNKVVSDFLTFAKPNPPVLERVKLNEIIKSIALMLESKLFIDKVDLKINLTEEEKTVLVDQNQIKQVILNIVQNAVEAMVDTLNPCIIITTGNHEFLNEVYISIRNNGKPLSEEEIAMLGTPFYTTKDNGTGLGLSICYRIIKEHGGRIEVESNSSQGTNFTIYLPYSEKMVKIS